MDYPVFQGLYDNKKTAEPISTYYGDVQEQKSSSHYQAVFDPMMKSLKGGAGRVFNHQDIIDYYAVFVGREKEYDAITKWVLDKVKKYYPYIHRQVWGKVLWLLI